MHWQPALQLDVNFLSIVPYLNLISLKQYLITGKELLKKTNIAIDQGNILGAIGAFDFFQMKKKGQQIKGEFDIIHLAHLDKYLYLMSRKEMNQKQQITLLWYARKNFEHWYSTIPKAKIQKFKEDWRLAIVTLEMAIKNVDGQVLQKGVVKQILKVLLNAVEDERTKRDHTYFVERFEEYTQIMFSNKKQIYFFNFIYEIQFICIEKLNEINLVEENPQLILNSILSELFYVSDVKRCFLSIEHMAYILKKIVKHLDKLDYLFTKYSNLLYTPIDRFQVVRQNLLKKADLFAFHMKEHLYFHYLQEIYRYRKFGQEGIIDDWKEKIRNSIENKNNRQYSPEKVDEAIFYIQLRKKQKYLFGHDSSLFAFPDISTNVVLGALTIECLRSYRQLKVTTDLKYSMQCMNILVHSPEDFFKSYQTFNILDKGIFVYYLHYFDSQDMTTKKKQTLEKSGVCIMEFLDKISCDQLIELIDFYLFEIELGNYYQIIVQHETKLNSINYFLYRSLYKACQRKIERFLHQKENVATTSDMRNLLNIVKEFKILHEAIYGENFVKACRTCKIYNEGRQCILCGQILFGLQLNLNIGSQISQKQSGKNKFRQNYCKQLQNRAEAIFQLIQNGLNRNRSQFFMMYSLVLEQIIDILN